MLNRRSFVGASALLPLLSAQTEQPLRTRADGKKLLFGAAAGWPSLRDDAEYAKHFAQECNLLVPENVLKMGLVHPAPDKYNFEPGDFMADFCKRNNMAMRGHTLVWHSQMGSWFKETVTKQNASQVLEDHITTVAGHYRGRMHSWDVVNEAILPKDGREDSLRNTPWLEVLGPDYLPMAFRFAQKADPNALLCYNEYGIDYDTPADEQKRAAVLKLLRKLKSDGAPVQALGVQAHLNAGSQNKFKADVLRRFFGEVAALGLKILITELDVLDKDLPDDIAERDKAVAECYQSYLMAALQEPAVIAVLTWGLTDKYTWLGGRSRNKAGRAVRVLPLDRDYGRKPAWYAIAKAIDSRR